MSKCWSFLCVHGEPWRNASFIHRFSATSTTAAFAEVKGFFARLWFAQIKQKGRRSCTTVTVPVHFPIQRPEKPTSQSHSAGRSAKRNSRLLFGPYANQQGCWDVCLFVCACNSPEEKWLSFPITKLFPRCRTSGAVKKKKKPKCSIALSLAVPSHFPSLLTSCVCGATPYFAAAPLSKW